ncbi:MAG: hypothetical protein ABSC94_08700 [Polyangiaceae bacterium]
MSRPVKSSAWFPTPSGSAFCRWCGHVVAVAGTTLPGPLVAPLPWAREPCLDVACESDAVLGADGVVIPRRSGLFPRLRLED